MSMHVFNWLMTSLYIFFALMVMTRFVFYRKEEGRRSVYFWGGCLFLTMALSDLTSNLFFGTAVHKWQTVMFLVLTLVTMFASMKTRRLASIETSIEQSVEA